MRLQSYGKHRMCCRLISPVSLLTLINPIVSCCANFCISFHQCSWLWSSRAPICLMKQWVGKRLQVLPVLADIWAKVSHRPSFSCFIPELPLIPNPALLCSAAMAAWFSLRTTASWAPSSAATAWPSCPSPGTCRPAAPTCCSRPPASWTSPTLQVRNLPNRCMDCTNHEVIHLFAGLGKFVFTAHS